MFIHVRGWRNTIERGLLLVGLALLGIYLVARIHSTLTERLALRALHESQLQVLSAKSPSGFLSGATGASLASDRDKELWSVSRRKIYEKSIVGRRGTPLAVLRISRLRMEVPVLEGTDQLTLNTGAGRISGTALPGEGGNIGIAGHRDGFFRSLKDIVPGDKIELIVGEQIDTYVVDKIQITSPRDVRPLRSSGKPELTLVTCYPFYFVGPAPKRYVVRASLRQVR